MTNDCRKAFEEWYSNHGSFNRDSDWIVWQAAWNLRQVDLDAVREVLEKGRKAPEVGIYGVGHMIAGMDSAIIKALALLGEEGETK